MSVSTLAPATGFSASTRLSSFSPRSAGRGDDDDVGAGAGAVDARDGDADLGRVAGAGGLALGADLFDGVGRVAGAEAGFAVGGGDVGVWVGGAVGGAGAGEARVEEVECVGEGGGRGAGEDGGGEEE